MRKKVMQVLCMFSALVVMICCAVPAFADDTGTTDNNLSNILQAISYMKQQIVEKGGTLNGKNYIAYYYYPNDSTISLCLISMPNDTLNLTNGKYLFEHYTPEIWCDFNKYDYTKWTDYDRFTISISSSTSTMFDGTQDFFIDESFSKSSWHIVDTNMKITNNGIDVTPDDPNAVPAPFTVSYTPELSLNMQNKIYYPSKGGANADENGLVSAENNNINLDIKLTPEFLKTFNEKDLGKAYGSGTYAVLCCLSKNLLNADDDLQRFFDEDVVLYAMNHDGNYYKGQDDEKVKSDGSVSDDLNSNGTVDTFEPYLTLYQGRTPIYTIPRDGKLSVAFDLTSIDYKTHGLTDDSKLYVNVIGVFVKNNGQVSVKNDEHKDNTNNSTWLGSYAYQEDFTNLKTCEKIDDFVKSVDEETGKPETFKAYRVYSVISDPFSYEKFPDYVPKVYKDKDGNTYNPSTTKLKDLCNIPPSKVTDVDLAKGSDGVIKDGSYMQPDDYDDYLKNKKLNLNFSDVDYTDLGTLFAVTGNYFKFLTCSLSILPDWFITIFTTWFILMLGIAIFKLAIGLSSAIPKG